MNSNIRNKFIKVGFEFTAAPKPNLKIKNKGLEIIESPYTKGDFFIVKRKSDSKISKYPWINRNIEADECGCEVSTPIITKLSHVTECYNQFMEFVKESDLTTEINKAYCGLGGGHIHIDLSYLEVEEKVAFLKNIAIFISNHPWLNWALNDPNDNVNANSLISKAGFRNVEQSVIDLSACKMPKKAKQAASPLEIFLIDPIRFALHKRFAIRYNRMYDTVEFRIFNMPNSLEEHLFHYKVAMAIYNNCLIVTKGGLKFDQDFLEERDYVFLDERVAISTLLKTIKILNLKPSESQIEKMISNIKTRYKWSYDDNENFTKNNIVNSEEFYLL